VLRFVEDVSMPSTACLPWYALPETEASHRVFWTAIARHLRQSGARNVPRRLTRGTPLVQRLVDPRLLFCQCCGYDLIYGFAGCVQLVATPVYTARGCDAACYRSLVLVRDDCRADCLDGLRDKVCVVNGFNSHSGTNALRALVAPLSCGGRFFSRVLVSGAHVESLAMLRSGVADVMAMDCVLHALLRRHRPHSLDGTRVLCRTDAVPAPPFVTAADAGSDLVFAIRSALQQAVCDDATRTARADMLLEGVEVMPLSAYARIIELEGVAAQHGYMEMHATAM
jgi:ABC-type phosphate/phosphonate transport system substrate-binding protein